ATLVGQNLGAGKPDRAERAVWLTSYYNMAFLGSVGVVFVLFAPAVVGFFTNEPDVLRAGTYCLRIVSAGYLFYAFGMVVVQAFNGAGDTVTPTIVNFFCFWMFQIPFAYIVAHPLGIGANGVYVAIAAAESLMAVVGGIIFRRGRWKQQQI
ncbi:MAG: MATE family efflux transporter, partial [Acidobacteriota bacterium]